MAWFFIVFTNDFVYYVEKKRVTFKSKISLLRFSLKPVSGLFILRVLSISVFQSYLIIQ